LFRRYGNGDFLDLEVHTLKEAWIYEKGNQKP
jgi:hypothetical protein